jgi:NAD(P)-dependent dehydrogenase (short-subunit alcohol dehydrogenase family)
MRLTGRRAVVTGGAAGIGRAIAEDLVREGASVVLHDADGDGVAHAAEEIRRKGGDVTGVLVDVTDRPAVRAAIAEADATAPVDILVNNAGINVIKRPADYTDDDWDRVLAVNLTGTWTYCQALGTRMAERGRGSIVNVASVASVMAHYQRAPYHASKAGVHLLTKSLAQDLGEFGVRVNAVGPGSVEATDMQQVPGHLRADAAVAITALRRRGKPAEIAAAVSFLVSDDASFITGHLLMVDGGMSIGTQIGATWTPGESFSDLDA